MTRDEINNNMNQQIQGIRLCIDKTALAETTQTTEGTKSACKSQQEMQRTEWKGSTASPPRARACLSTPCFFFFLLGYGWWRTLQCFAIRVPHPRASSFLRDFRRSAESPGGQRRRGSPARGFRNGTGQSTVVSWRIVVVSCGKGRKDGGGGERTNALPP